LVAAKAVFMVAMGPARMTAIINTGFQHLAFIPPLLATK